MTKYKNCIIFITFTLFICLFLWLERITAALFTEHLLMIWWATINSQKNHITRFNLDLTMDEFYILEELALGKYQKEIRKFSKNTITKKLKQARQRNKLSSTAELVLLYRENYRKNGNNPMKE